jgi:hypothetical protein
MAHSDCQALKDQNDATLVLSTEKYFRIFVNAITATAVAMELFLICQYSTVDSTWSERLCKYKEHGIL